MPGSIAPESVNPERESESLGSEVAERLAQATEDYFCRVAQQGDVDVAEFAARYPDVESILLDILPALQIVGHGSVNGTGPAFGSSSTLEAGVHLGDFRLIEEIGRGGMGVVYLAEQQSLERNVALKILPFMATLDPRRIKRFQNESQAVAGLEHPNIVDVYSVGTETGIHFYAMRYIDGFSLAEVLGHLRLRSPGSLPSTADDHEAASQLDTRPNRTTLPESLRSFGPEQDRFRAVARMFVDVADAIQHSHECGVIHRDLKPSNIMLDSTGKAWVTDFGLAQVINDGSLTLTNDLVGTLRYMAPEQLEAGQAADHRIDVYGLGATLYEMLTTQPLVEGHDRETILSNLRSGAQRSPRFHDVRIPKDLETIVLKSVERVPANRFQSARELSQDLQRWLNGLPVSARPVGRASQAVRWCRRNPVVASLLTATFMLLAVVAVGSLVATRQISNQNQQLVAERDSLLEERRRATQILETITSGNAREYITQRDMLTPEQTQLFSQVADLFQSYTSLSQDTPEERLRQARVYERIGGILADIGRDDQSIDAYQRSLASYRILVAEPHDAKLDMELALVERSLAAELREIKGEFERARELLQSAIRRLASLQGNSPELRYWSLVTKKELGILQSDLGNWDEAVATLEAVRIELRSLSEQYSDDDDSALAFASLCHRLGLIARELGDFNKANRYFDDSIETCQRLVEAGRGSREIRRQLGDSYSIYGNSLRHQDRFQQSIQQHSAAVRIFEKLVADFPNIRGFEAGLESAKNNFAIVLMQTGSLDEAAQQLTDARASLVPRSEAFPDDLDTIQSLAANLANTGKVFEYAKEYDRALEFLGKSNQFVSQTLERHANNDMLRLYKRNTNWTMAKILDRTAQYSLATDKWNTARAFDDRGFLDIEAGVALNHARLGRYGHAHSEAVRLLDTGTKDREVLFDCARIFALNAQVAESASEKQELLDKALLQLEKAAKSNFRLPDLALEEPAFQDITSHPSFVAFVERVRANAARDFSLDRLIAQQVLDLGGRVTVSVENQGVEVDPGQAIPDGSIELEWIMFFDHELPPGFLSRLPELAFLEGLDLCGTNVTDQDILPILDMNTLTHVYVHRTKLTDKTCSAIASLPNLKQANFSATRITNRTLAALAGNERLELLDVSDTQINDDGLPYIGTLTGLLILDLHSTNLSDRGAKSLAKLSQLSELEIQKTQITSQTLKAFHSLPLTELWIEKRLQGNALDALQAELPNCLIYLE